jgi:hypothetical protein
MAFLKAMYELLRVDKELVNAFTGGEFIDFLAEIAAGEYAQKILCGVCRGTTIEDLWPDEQPIRP